MYLRFIGWFVLSLLSEAAVTTTSLTMRTTYLSRQTPTLRPFISRGTPSPPKGTITDQTVANQTHWTSTYSAQPATPEDLHSYYSYQSVDPHTVRLFITVIVVLCAIGLPLAIIVAVLRNNGRRERNVNQIILVQAGADVRVQDRERGQF